MLSIMIHCDFIWILIHELVLLSKLYQLCETDGISVKMIIAGTFPGLRRDTEDRRSSWAKARPGDARCRNFQKEVF